MAKEYTQEEIEAIIAENKRLKEAKESTDEAQDRLKAKAEESRILISQNKALGERNAAIQEQFKLLETLEKIKGDAFVSTKEYQKLEERYNAETDSARKKKIKDQMESLENQALEEQGLLDLYNQTLKSTEGEEKYSKARAKNKKVIEETFTGIGTKLGIISPAMNSFTKKLVDFGERARKDPKALADGFKDAINPKKILLGLFANVLSQTFKLAMAVDKASAAFAANTGAGRAMTEEIMSVGGSFRNLGLGAEEAGKAAQGLFNNFTGFMQTSKEGRKELMKTVATLEKIGVSGEIAAKSLQIMAHNFGMSTKRAASLTKQLAIAGTKIGISSSKMMQGFVDASKSLAVYGKDSIKVFSDLAAQAKAAGVETATLLGLAEKFDTFSSAADTVGKLNSILGTQLSATEMLTMKENERIETLISSIQAQGIAFKDMDRFSQKAIANAAGISDMAEAQRIFGMNVGEYRKGLRDSVAEEEFNQRVKDAMDVMQKLTKAFQNFAIQVAPLVNGIAFLAQKFLDFSQALGGLPAMIIALAGAIFFLMLILPTFMSVFTTFLPAMIAGLTAAAPALGVIGAVIGIVLVAALLALAGTLAMLNLGKLESLATIFGSLTSIGNIGIAVKGVRTVTTDLKDSGDDLKPILGDLALLSTGKTTQSLTTSTVGYSLNTFAAKFENSFKPNVTVKIGNEEFKDFVLDAQADGAKG